MDYLETLRVHEAPYGCYRYRPGAAPGWDLYATTDVAILRTVMGENLRATLSDDQCRQWIDGINAFAQEDGVYRPGGHSDQHRNGMVIGALGPLGGRQKFPVQFYKDFDTTEKVGAWLEKIDWSRQWPASHLFWGGIHCYSMSRHCTAAWLDAVFDWLDANLDPETGWWRLGVEHADRDQPLGGGAHIWPIYQHHGRRFSCPERTIDGILSMQRRDGSWLRFGHYLDLDALYGLAYLGAQAVGYRTAEIDEAVQRHGDLAQKEYRAFMNRRPDTHSLLAMVGGLGLLWQLAPGRFHDTIPWTDIFSDIRLYATAAVECN
jgi:hypothetical protein